ncbi:triose-phosphate isomerase [Acidimicrobiia bacterium]|jgi:triosephosphate isomerase|nr:triose-phosphate isomerase [Acidimicrobiia bacterium]MDA8668016.1 triose-phosphate isomerase [Candidatus Actinomarina sp.]MDA8813138.1 triose-phosphate isomerase [Candidatus Actinomarina sp.]MDA9198150.1 triose-phosphate isomerase [Acidimicrobiia bacterium]MDA9862702.1 triose-phosphate isomerase [Acidimicrobiia bacterium]|tara:strand:- start:561 stop:1325 length:765 start_codon:yes stop_codon:yes gene_type:complete
MKKIIIGNWKLNLEHLEAIQLLQKLNYSLEVNIEDNIDIVIAPSYTSLRSLQTIIDADNLKIKISSQDVSAFIEGAYTGEVSALQLSKLNITHSIIGHSERRTVFNETDETINLKVHNAVNNNIIPIVCFGESEEQRDTNEYLSYILNQVNIAVKGLRKDKVEEIIFAYEPIWAIGTGKVASVENAIEVISSVKQEISTKPFYDEEKIRFIYGGSVSPTNASELLNTKIIDGALVGGASLDVDKFVQIIKSVKL